MGRKLIWPLPREEHWQEQREQWRTLQHEEKTETLRDWSEAQDRRLARLEGLLGLVTKLFWIVLAAFVSVAVKEYVASYQIVRTGQVILPAPTGQPTTAPDFQKTAPRPSAGAP